MSAMEAQDGDNEGKVGLKRKLTGPPRLLLSKFKCKGHQEEKETRGLKDVFSNGTQRDLVLDHPCTILEEESSQASPEDSKRPVEMEGAMMVRRNSADPTIAGGGTARENPDSRHETRRRLVITAWKRCSFSSLFCVKGSKRKSGKMSVEEVDTQPRGVLSGGEKSTTEDCSSQRGTHRTVTSDLPVNSATTGTFSPFTWGTFKKLLGTVHSQPKSKGKQLEEISPFTPENAALSHVSLKNKLGGFFKRRTKKPSPFLHEKLVGTQEYIEEENIVLSSRCADEDCLEAPLDHQEDYSVEEGSQVREIRSETMTVSVEVTPNAPVDEGEEDISDAEANEGDFNDCESTQNDRPTKEQPPEYEDELESTTAASSEAATAGVRHKGFVTELQKGTQAALYVPASSATADANFELQVEEPVLLVTRHHTDPGVHPNEGEECKDVMEDNVSPKKMEDKGTIQDNSPLGHSEIIRVIISGDTSDLSALEELQAANGECVTEPSVDGLGAQCRDILLNQTACALVQAAIEAALDQLKHETKGNMSKVYNEPPELQGHT